MRWFGESWGAAVCDPKMHSDTPVGQPCARCSTLFKTSDRGVTMPYMSSEPDFTLIHYHLPCLMRSLGLERNDV